MHRSFKSNDKLLLNSSLVVFMSSLLHIDIIFSGVELNFGIFPLNPLWSFLPIEHLWTGEINRPLAMKPFVQPRLVSYCYFFKLILDLLSSRTTSKVSSSTLINSYIALVLIKIFKNLWPSLFVPKSSNRIKIKVLGYK